MRIASLTPEIASAMHISFNGVSPENVARGINGGQYALVSRGEAFAILSRAGDTICLEAVEGPGGTLLAKELVDGARAAGLACEAWVLSNTRERLAARAGMFPTGATRVCANGSIQSQVTT